MPELGTTWAARRPPASPGSRQSSWKRQGEDRRRQQIGVLFGNWPPRGDGGPTFRRGSKYPDSQIRCSLTPGQGAGERDTRTASRLNSSLRVAAMLGLLPGGIRSEPGAEPGQVPPGGWPALSRPTCAFPGPVGRPGTPGGGPPRRACGQKGVTGVGHMTVLSMQPGPGEARFIELENEHDQQG